MEFCPEHLKSKTYTPNRDDKHPRPYHMGVPPPPGPMGHCIPIPAVSLLLQYLSFLWEPLPPPPPRAHRCHNTTKTKPTYSNQLTAANPIIDSPVGVLCHIDLSSQSCSFCATCQVDCVSKKTVAGLRLPNNTSHNLTRMNTYSNLKQEKRVQKSCEYTGPGTARAYNADFHSINQLSVLLLLLDGIDASQSQVTFRTPCY